MIFVTVGTELAFDRLVQTVDEWAYRHGRKDVFAQIGPSIWRPRHIEWAHFIDASECRRRIAAAKVVVAHAGMGTILTAREFGKSILVMPRRASLNEHRSNHQVDTTKELAAQGSIIAAMDENELLEKLGNLDNLPAADRISGYAPKHLLDRISNFIELGVLGGGADVSTGKYEPNRLVPQFAASNAAESGPVSGA